jgi:hypothetical protein
MNISFIVKTHHLVIEYCEKISHNSVLLKMGTEYSVATLKISEEEENKIT